MFLDKTHESIVGFS